MSKRSSILVVALLVLTVVLAGCQVCPEVEPLGVSHYEGIEISGSETDALVVNQTSTGDVVEFRDGGTVVARIADGGGLNMLNYTITNVGDAGTDFTSSGGLTLAGPLAVDDGSEIAVTYGSTITPSTGYIVITSTTAITNAVLAACTQVGQLAFVTCNSGSGDITILESTTLEAGGDVALDASEEDVILVVCNGAKWLKVAPFSNN